MATILVSFGSGGANLNPNGSSGSPSLATALRDIADDLTELRTKLAAGIVDLAALRTAITGITAKLDADAGVTDTNYAATQNPATLTASAPAALKTIKG